MPKIIRTFFALFFVISPLITTPALASLKKPHWLRFSHEDNSSFWSQMSRDFSIECNENNPSVQKHIQWYLEHPKHLNYILKKSEPFIHYVYEQTQRRNLPAELALIPLLESQYNPASGARYGPAGLWQMMPGTATKYGLKINHSYDGRKDVSASTKAALNYLSYLHHYCHEDWLLALAAYQTGEGRINIDGRHDFWQMPLSRRTNVSRILAIASIIKRHGNYNVRLPVVREQTSLKELTWNEAKVINLTETAKNLGIDQHTLRQFNPAFRQNVANVPGKITLLVPGESNDEQQAIESTANRANEKEAIAELPVPVANNKNIELPNQLQLVKEDKQASQAQLPEPKQSKEHGKQKPTPQKYTIKRDDSPSSIAKKFHVSVKKLQSTNHFTNAKHLKVGRKIIIPN